MSDFAQTVKQQADIVKVIGAYIRLRKSGAQNYSGLCPFHKEKSPSFNVHAGKLTCDAVAKAHGLPFAAYVPK